MIQREMRNAKVCRAGMSLLTDDDDDDDGESSKVKGENASCVSFFSISVGFFKLRVKVLMTDVLNSIRNMLTIYLDYDSCGLIRFEVIFEADFDQSCSGASCWTLRSSLENLKHAASQSTYLYCALKLYTLFVKK